MSKTYSVAFSILNKIFQIQTNDNQIYLYLQQVFTTSAGKNKPFCRISILMLEGKLVITTNKNDNFSLVFSQNIITSPLHLVGVLKYFLQKYCSDFDGLVIHASSVVFKGKAYLFAGKSGVGKTTIARNSYLPALSDDTAILFMRKNKVFVEGSILDVNLKNRIKNTLPLGTRYAIDSIYFLKHSKVNHINKLGVSATCDKLFENVLFEEEKGQTINSVYLDTYHSKVISNQNIIKRIFDIVVLVPAYNLFFTKNFKFDPDNLNI